MYENVFMSVCVCVRTNITRNPYIKLNKNEHLIISILYIINNNVFSLEVEVYPIL